VSAYPSRDGRTPRPPFSTLGLSPPPSSRFFFSGSSPIFRQMISSPKLDISHKFFLSLFLRVILLLCLFFVARMSNPSLLKLQYSWPLRLFRSLRGCQFSLRGRVVPLGWADLRPCTHEVAPSLFFGISFSITFLTSTWVYFS